MTKVSLKSYFEPTPVNIRKAADSLLVGALYIQLNPDLLGYKYTRLVTLIIVGAKMLSNFFSTGPVQNTDPRNDPSSPL